jgi:hypothetical protein
MNEIRGWAAWHPVKGFDKYDLEGSVAFADLSSFLLIDIKEKNKLEDPPGNNKTGWRAVRVKVVKE